MKIKEFENGTRVIMGEPSISSGMVEVICLGKNGQVIDKIKCDTRRMAREYFRAFEKIAKNA